ncbi:MAG: DUF4292 domain-containing protein [Saprospiraceae bacterium]|nr:DUF4292 domain-containing protein [Saprospiraceae bacterium]
MDKTDNGKVEWHTRPAATSLTNGFRYFALLLLLVGISAQDSGCRRRKVPSGPAKPATVVLPANFLQDKLRNRDVSGIQTLSARADIYAEGDGQAVSANANIIWIRDSVLWVNVKKLGIEAARALVTKDSIYLLNRLDKTYTIQGLESLQRQYSLPAGFDLLQSAVLASAWFFPDISLQSDIKEGFHRLSGSNGSTGTEYKMEEGSYVLRSETFVQTRDTRVVTFGFDRYKKLAGAGFFPYFRSVEAYSPETGTLRLQLQLSDVEVNVPKNYRFQIPEHYERIE